MAAALLAVLLLLGMPQGGVYAQTNDGAALRTITNIAEATWDENGWDHRVASNPVRFDVRPAPIAPPLIRVFRLAPGDGSELVYRPPNCGGTTGPIQVRNSAALSSPNSGINAVSALNTAIVQQTDHLRGGEPLYFEVSAARANRDPTTIDNLTVVITSADGVNRRSIGTPYRRAKGPPLPLCGSVDAGRVFRAAGGVGRA